MLLDLAAFGTRELKTPQDSILVVIVTRSATRLRMESDGFFDFPLSCGTIYLSWPATKRRQQRKMHLVQCYRLCGT